MIKNSVVIRHSNGEEEKWESGGWGKRLFYKCMRKIFRLNGSEKGPDSTVGVGETVHAIIQKTQRSD